MGKVYLVGAGPGSPDLLTVKAARLLGSADVVLHDGLVTQAILDLIRPKAEVIDIGKRCGRKLLTQAEIDHLLVAFASSSEVVIRLKGGDPSIFGRAGEEIEALNDAGVPFEIVPGITTAVAAAASAGISLTDRRYASSVVFLTAHRENGERSRDWDRLVTSGSTLAIYMPGSEYRELSEQLCNAGVDPRTPCAVVSCVARPEERTVLTTVKGLARCTALPAPTHVIVGCCANPLEALEFVVDRAPLTFEEETKRTTS